MSSKAPVFPILEDPQHFSDYGFDPQFDYLQVLEEAKKHKNSSSRSVEALHFKLQKPISKEENNKKRKKKWWKNALLFWRKKWDHHDHQQQQQGNNNEEENENGYKYRGYVSGPVYITESRSGSVTPCRASSTRTISGPIIAGSFTPMRRGDGDMMSYVSLRELNMEHQHSHRISTSALPIYLVT